MDNDRSADDEYWRRVHDADEEAESAGDRDPSVKTDPDEVRGWAEERDAVPVNDSDLSGPEAYALRHENVVDGSAHERISWEDFAAAFRGEDMAFHHAEGDDEAGTHRFVSRSEAEGPTDEDRSEAAEPDIGAAETESGRAGVGTPSDDGEGAVVGDRGRGVESGTAADAEAGTGTGRERAEADSQVASDAGWSLDDVDEGDSVVDDQGETMGIVTAVDADAIYVDPDPGLTEKLSAKLGWTDRDDAEYTIEASDVAGVEGGDVRLKPATL